MATVPDPKELEGRKEGQTPAPQSRDFFWDSITLYIVSAILALTAIDVVTEFVRGSKVQCYLPNEADSSILANVQGYVNELCAARLPSLQYLPALIAIHAILILAPHYVWLNGYGANLDFFFQHVSKLSRTRNPKTGDYPPINYTISKQLELAFSRSNWMYWSYLFIVFVQLCLCIGGILVSPLWLFKEREQGVPFNCSSNDTKGDSWPLPDYERVICVISSIHLLQRIWVVYLFLLAVAATFLALNMIKMIKRHADELGNKNRAMFSFQTGISYDHYIPQPLLKTASNNVKNALSSKPHIESKEPPPRRKLVTVWRRIKFVVYSLMDCVLHPFAPYSIGSNYDFLVVKLFRTDGGLAYVLREVHVLRFLRGENKSDRAKAYIYNYSSGGSHGASEVFLKADIGWNLPLTRPSNPMLVLEHRQLVLPRKVRGIVLGFSLRCRGSTIECPLPRGSSARAGSMNNRAKHSLQVAEKQGILAEMRRGAHYTQPDCRPKTPCEKRAEAIQKEAECLARNQSQLNTKRLGLDYDQQRVAKTDRALLQLQQRMKRKCELMEDLDKLRVSTQEKSQLDGVKDHIMRQMLFDISVQSREREWEQEQMDLDRKVNELQRGGSPLKGGETLPKDGETLPRGGETLPKGGGSSSECQQLSYDDLANDLKKETEKQLDEAINNILRKKGLILIAQTEKELALAVKQSGNEFCGALCIGFDSESQGFASALARIFYRVGLINFSSHYEDYENPLRIDVDDASCIFSVTTPHDILMRDDLLSYELPLDLKDKKNRTVYIKMSEKFLDDLNEVWKPKYISTKRADDIRLAQREEREREGLVPEEDWYRERDELSHFSTDYIVIGPLSDDFQVATVNKLLSRMKRNISSHAVLLTIQPIQVGGKCVTFKKYTLSKEYNCTCLNAKVVDDDKDWPSHVNEFPLERSNRTEFDIEVGGTTVNFRFTLYQRKSN